LWLSGTAARMHTRGAFRSSLPIVHSREFACNYGGFVQEALAREEGLKALRTHTAACFGGPGAWAGALVAVHACMPGHCQGERLSLGRSSSCSLAPCISPARLPLSRPGVCYSMQRCRAWRGARPAVHARPHANSQGLLCGFPRLEWRARRAGCRRGRRRARWRRDEQP